MPVPLAHQMAGPSTAGREQLPLVGLAHHQLQRTSLGNGEELAVCVHRHGIRDDQRVQCNPRASGHATRDACPFVTQCGARPNRWAERGRGIRAQRTQRARPWKERQRRFDTAADQPRLLEPATAKCMVK